MGEHEVAPRAVFLDRDGVLNRPSVREGRPYPPARVDDFELYDDVSAGLDCLASAGFLLIVVTNQPDVGRGTQAKERVEAMHEKMKSLLPQICRIETCWHAGSEWNDPCECRKPKPGMILRAAEELNIDLPQSFMIGDRWRDVDCGSAAGCRTVLINRGYAESLKTPPDWTVGEFQQAVKAILHAGVRSLEAP